MQLRWPPSVSYQENVYPDDHAGSLHRALCAQVDRMRTIQESGQYTHGASPGAGIESSQAPPPEPINTGYGPLHGTTIRILRLLPGGHEDPLHGHFELIHLRHQDPRSGEPGAISVGDEESPTPYEAVSYTWANSLGDREKNRVIYIGDRWDMLHITENCFDALRTCRFQRHDRRLWIDAVCINQTDNPERSHQVGMMRSVYSAARRVLIFLGMDHTQKLTGSVSDDPEIVIKNPYFSRVWVIQEVASAKEALVLYAGLIMHWNFFHTNLGRLPIKTWVHQFDRARRIDIDSFVTLLEDTRGCHATDPRDKVFALLGLSMAPLEPDYTLSLQAVYTGLAASLVTKNQELAGRILDLASHGHVMPGLPSWVPDWSFLAEQVCQKRWIEHPPLAVESWDRRPRGKQQLFRVHRETGSLCVQAVEIDTLARFLRHGFHAASNGMATATAGKVSISAAKQVASRCEPHDRVFSLSRYKFSLILRKVADPHIYTLVGLCEYSVQSNLKTVEVETIRHLVDWEWLLSDGGMWSWSEAATWEKAQKVWSSLEDLYKLERRAWLQRLILKARFVKQLLNLAESARHISSSCETKSPFLRRRWTRTCREWQAADSRLALLRQQRGRHLRELLPGYRSLDASQKALETVQLDQSMWLPVTYDWFEWSERRTEVIMHTRYPLLDVCAAKRIPLPPFQLVHDLKRQLILSTGAGLETGLRQLQRLAQDYPLKPPASTPKSHPYVFETHKWYSICFRDEYWGVFLGWLAKPTSPSTSYLNSKSSQNSMIIWEAAFGAQPQIDNLHRALDSNFDKHLACLDPSPDREARLEQFFVLVYREQFGLLWHCLISLGYNTDRATSAFHTRAIGAEFARAFYWRFSRSLDKACQLARSERAGSCEIEEQWTKFLGWLAQGSFDPHAVGVRSVEVVSPPRPAPDTVNERFGSDLFNLLQVQRWFRSTEGSEPWVDECLSELVHSEIQRRRLAERVFAPLFDETYTLQQSGLEPPTFEAAVPHDIVVTASPRLIEEWRRRGGFWREMMDYVSASEWHMSILKLRVLGGLMQDGATGNPEDLYKDIVIV